jgi:hypothetical protein
VSLLETDLDQGNQAEERFDHGCPTCRFATKTSIPSMRTRFCQRTTPKSFGFRTLRAVEITLYHILGELAEPECSHRSC